MTTELRALEEKLARGAVSAGNMDSANEAMTKDFIGKHLMFIFPSEVEFSRIDI